jgi:hypothetical protein
MLMGVSPEAREQTFQAWKKGELEYIRWVEAHPAPKQEWLVAAEYLRRMD